jgi:hypothetical protein
MRHYWKIPCKRFVSQQKTGGVFEKEFKQSINVVEGQQNKVSGPIWLKGGIPVESSEGTT